MLLCCFIFFSGSQLSSALSKLPKLVYNPRGWDLLPPRPHVPSCSPLPQPCCSSWHVSHLPEHVPLGLTSTCLPPCPPVCLLCHWVPIFNITVPWETFPHLSGLSRCSEDLCFPPRGIYYTILSNYLFSPLSFFGVLTTGTRSGSFPPVNADCMCWCGSLVRTGGKEFSWSEIPTESSYWSRPGLWAWSRLLLK